MRRFRPEGGDPPFRSDLPVSPPVNAWRTLSTAMTAAPSTILPTLARLMRSSLGLGSMGAGIEIV
jgi:hypothetical protein